MWQTRKATQEIMNGSRNAPASPSAFGYQRGKIFRPAAQEVGSELHESLDCASSSASPLASECESKVRCDVAYKTAVGNEVCKFADSERAEKEEEEEATAEVDW